MASGNEYPMTYYVRIPELDADLTVKCVVEDQELYFPKEDEDEYNHYEGAASVSGTYGGKEVKGYTYVELVGDWSKK